MTKQIDLEKRLLRELGFASFMQLEKDAEVLAAAKLPVGRFEEVVERNGISLGYRPRQYTSIVEARVDGLLGELDQCVADAEAEMRQLRGTQLVSTISEDLGAAQAQLDRARRRRDVVLELAPLARRWVLLRDREEAKAELRSVAVTPRVLAPATIASPVVASGGHPLFEADRIVTERAFYARQVERARGIGRKRDTADELVDKVVRLDAALEAWNDAHPRLARALEVEAQR